jgi:hypothetical protein
MYSVSTIPVDAKDRGLGFDFSDIADVVKNAATVGLNIYKNQMQLKQTKALAQVSYPSAIPNVGTYQAPFTGMPIAPTYAPMTNVPQPMLIPQQSGGISTTTLLLIGGAVLLGGILLMKGSRTAVAA